MLSLILALTATPAPAVPVPAALPIAEAARGSLRAVGYLADKQSGEYDMFDVLNLK